MQAKPLVRAAYSHKISTGLVKSFKRICVLLLIYLVITKYVMNGIDVQEWLEFLMKLRHLMMVNMLVFHSGVSYLLLHSV